MVSPTDQIVFQAFFYRTLSVAQFWLSRRGGRGDRGFRSGGINTEFVSECSERSVWERLSENISKLRRSRDKERMPTVILEAAIDTTLFRWTLMQTAVNNESGGPDSLRIANRTASNIFDLFKDSDGNYRGRLIEILKKGLTDLNTVPAADDTSLSKVANRLSEIYEDLIQGNFEAVQKLIDDEDVTDDDDDDASNQKSGTAVPVDKPNSC